MTPLLLPTREELGDAFIYLQNKNIRSSLFKLTDNHYLKLDCRLLGGSYKIRGVDVFISQLKHSSSIQVSSAGNLALATAIRLKEKNIACEAIVPKGISAIKRNALEEAGANIREHEFTEVWSMVNNTSLATSPTFLHPLNQHLLAGYGTIMLELQQQGMTQGNLIIPYGLGGLACALVNAKSALNLDWQIYLCEIEHHAPFSRALNGDMQLYPKMQSFIEAMGLPNVLPDVFAYLKDKIAGVITVTEDMTKHAIQFAANQLNLKIEGAAGATFAAMQHFPAHVKVVALMSGENISTSVLMEITKLH